MHLLGIYYFPFHPNKNIATHQTAILLSAGQNACHTTFYMIQRPYMIRCQKCQQRHEQKPKRYHVMFQCHQMSLLTARTCPQNPHSTCESMQCCSLGNLANLTCVTSNTSAPDHALWTEKARCMHCRAKHSTAHHEQAVALHYQVNVLPSCC